ncbi:MAG: tRNA (adenosine(37)-N6)-threonylcarbamoyltransferase complex ATPase subunit type 1 TsaE [Deltaproteobacteria bacterium]|nr:tRNA (adenosine(37)-N6)-threonylcarbamoyltransferase complex ATPase subunit type 1 TsaE [Deltaproteobacteria bacterium]
MEKGDVAIRSRSSDDTDEVGFIIGGNAGPGAVIALIGDLGAGKTCLTRGIAKALGINEGYYVTSPTFTLLNEYPGRLNLYHFDIYRLRDWTDLEDIGCEEYFDSDGVTVIEWAEKIASALPERALFVYLAHSGGEETRTIRIEGDIDMILRLQEDFQRGGFL